MASRVLSQLVRVPLPKLVQKPLVRPLSVQKQRYVDLLRDDACRVLLVHGVAGSGKSYHAVEEGLNQLSANKVEKIVFTKPMCVTDELEDIGFLPGNESKKISIHYQHVHDILEDLLVPSKLSAYLDKGRIVFVPLGYVRGRTLKNSYIVGDEFQNTNTHMIKSFLTRIGEGSRMVLTGDISQTDRVMDKPSGLEDFLRRVAISQENSKTIQSVYLTDEDIVRDPIVEEIIKLYNLDLETDTKNV
jgi:phosphate starvation-inducible protein PhoH and related proteins